MMATKENIPYSMMGFVFEKLVPSLLPTDDQIRPRYFLSSSRFILVLLTLNMKSGPQLQFHDFFFIRIDRIPLFRCSKPVASTEKRSQAAPRTHSMPNF